MMENNVNSSQHDLNLSFHFVTSIRLPHSNSPFQIKKMGLVYHKTSNNYNHVYKFKTAKLTLFYT
ncbi:hypothetical protein HanPSC8_Chr03g0120241 [Helianthus annuus]|nr:hypothetical protein HanPSC8_Chr03g0120241 [Helianthus annuus]